MRTTKNRDRKFFLALILPALFAFQTLSVRAQGTAFTYQGRLNSNGGAAAGYYDFRFRLAADNQGNNYVGSPFLTNAVVVTNGLFVTTIDFGSGIFNGANYWLEVDVRTNGATGYTPLYPLQAVTPAPYAIMANSASNVLGNIPAAQITGTVASANLSGNYGNPVSFNNAGNSFTGNGTGLTNVNAATLNGLSPANFWQTGGNGGTTPGVNYLGTSDNQPLELHVNNQRALRLEFGGASALLGLTTPTGAPNVIGGAPGNFVSAGVVGSVIGGGGATNWNGGRAINSIGSFSDFSVIGGGFYNNIGSNSVVSFIGGGEDNLIQTNSDGSVIGGGEFNNIETGSPKATIAGGGGNIIYNDADGYGGSAIGGGENNAIHARSDHAVIGGGLQNSVGQNDYEGVIAGGYQNNMSDLSGYSFIGSGQGNIIESNSTFSSVVGGYQNTIGTNAQYSVVGGGLNNAIYGDSLDYGTSVIGGGDGDTIYPGSFNSVIGGGQGNSIGTNSDHSVISGGLNNIMGRNDYEGVIAGGYQNNMSDLSGYSFIGSGQGNAIKTSSSYSSVIGGYQNTIRTNAPYSVVGGGLNNTIYGDHSSFGTSVIGGGDNETVYPGSYNSVIDGGQNNSIGTNSDHCVIGGGQGNGIGTNSDHCVIGGGGYLGNIIQNNCSDATIVGGDYNVIQNNSPYSTIAGGTYNVISNNAAYAFAAGAGAEAAHSGAFVWSDGSTYTWSTVPESVTFRASGGYRFFTGGGTGGATLAAGATSWTAISDRNAKKDFAPVDYQTVLNKLAQVPVERWHYKWEKNTDTLNIGPMAQDFIGAFFPGRDDKGISTLEFDGVELAAIQGLNQKLTKELSRQAAENSDLKARLEKLERMMSELTTKH